MDILKPKSLAPGDTIAVVSPASPSMTTVYQDRGIEAFERLGYRVITAKHANDKHLLFAGKEKIRARDINCTAFQDKSCRRSSVRGAAVLCDHLH